MSPRSVVRSVLVLSLACAGCGGGPAKSADDVESAGADDAEASAAASEAGAADAGAAEGQPEPAKDAARGEASKEDVQAVLQLVIDDEELTPYLHLERPDRFPIRIAGELPPGLELTKATQPVEIVDAAQAKDKPVIVFTEVSVQGDSANVRYRYDVEGVRGACTLGKRDGRWVLLRSRVTAR